MGKLGFVFELVTKLDALDCMQGPHARRLEGLLRQHVRRHREAEQDGAPPRLPRRQRARRHHEQHLTPDLAGAADTYTVQSGAAYHSQGFEEFG